MTDVFKLNVGENTVVNAYDMFTSYQLAEVLTDALSVVQCYTADLFYDMYCMTNIQRDVKGGAYGEHPQRVWGLRLTGSDLVSLDSWDRYDSYRTHAKIAFVLTFGEYGINFERIK